MAVDFSALVIQPAMDVFGIPVIIDPIASQPGALPYQAVGIFSSRQYEVALESGGAVSDQRTTMDFRIAHFVVPPKQRDKVTVMETGIAYWIADIADDGQGGRQVILRREAPPPFNV